MLFRSVLDSPFQRTKMEFSLAGNDRLLQFLGLIDYYRGNKLVLINKSTTPMDSCADLLIQAGLGEVFGQIEV